ncbi:MAG: ABC transporter ATP-binding protein [Micrococcales bacterium]
MSSSQPLGNDIGAELPEEERVKPPVFLEPGKTPVVVVDDVHLKYRVFASGKKVTRVNSRVKRKGRLREIHALQGVSMVAYEGDSIGVIGTNGSGKSTLMKAISGILPIDAGAVWASSRPSFLGVGAAMIKQLSGEKNVILGGLAVGMSRAEIKAKFDHIVDFAGIRDFIDLPMETYSSGMVERLKFSIAAAREHDILIIDEALAVGDQDFRRRSEARMRELASGAGCVFLVSHSMKSILDTCNRAIWLDKGIVKMDGPAIDVCRAYAAAQGAPLDD